MRLKVAITSLFLMVLLTQCLVLAFADVTLSGTNSFNYDSEGGVTGTVTITETYTLASPVSLTATELFFNLTGKTTSLASSQFQFSASSTGGAIPIRLETSVSPTYVLNVASYSYSSPDITASTQTSSQTVTVDFSTILSSGGDAGLKLYSATAPITSVSSSTVGTTKPRSSPAYPLGALAACPGYPPIPHPCPFYEDEFDYVRWEFGMAMKGGMVKVEPNGMRIYAPPTGGIDVFRRLNMVAGE